LKIEAEEGLGGAIRPAERMRPGRQVGGWRIGRAEEGDAARTAGGGRKPESGGRRREALQAGRKREKQGRQRKEQLFSRELIEDSVLTESLHTAPP
jgi:hypothetical protein